MRRSIEWAGLAGLLAAALTGCGDAPTATREELTEAEVRDLGARVRRESVVVLSVVPLGFGFNVHACAGEGAVFSQLRDTASVADPQTGMTREAGKVKESHIGCNWNNPFGAPILSDGTVEYRYQTHHRLEGPGRVSGSASMVGRGSITLSDRAGRSRVCPVDLAYQLDLRTGQGSAKGTFCATPVDEVVALPR